MNNIIVILQRINIKNGKQKKFEKFQNSMVLEDLIALVVKFSSKSKKQ